MSPVARDTVRGHERPVIGINQLYRFGFEPIEYDWHGSEAIIVPGSAPTYWRERRLITFSSLPTSFT